MGCEAAPRSLRDGSEDWSTIVLLLSDTTLPRTFKNKQLQSSVLTKDFCLLLRSRIVYCSIIMYKGIGMTNCVEAISPPKLMQKHGVVELPVMSSHEAQFSDERHYYSLRFSPHSLSQKCKTASFYCRRPLYPFVPLNSCFVLGKYACAVKPLLYYYQRGSVYSSFGLQPQIKHCQ